MGRRAGARARPRDPAARPARGGQQGGPLAPGHARDRQALRRVAGRGPGDRGHLQLLPRRGAAAVRPDRAVRDVRQAAVHLPQPGRGGGHHHRRQLPGRRALVVPGPRPAVRQRGGVEAGRVRARDSRGAGPALPARRPARRRPQPRAGRRPADLRRARAGARPRPGRQGRLHRLERGRRRDRGAVRAPPAVAVPGARRQEPARRHGRRRPRPRRRGGAVQRLSAPPASAAPRWAR